MQEALRGLVPDGTIDRRFRICLEAQTPFNRTGCSLCEPDLPRDTRRSKQSNGLQPDSPLLAPVAPNLFHHRTYRPAQSKLQSASTDTGHKHGETTPERSACGVSSPCSYALPSPKLCRTRSALNRHKVVGARDLLQSLRCRQVPHLLDVPLRIELPPGRGTRHIPYLAKDRT